MVCPWIWTCEAKNIVEISSALASLPNLLVMLNSAIKLNFHTREDDTVWVIELAYSSFQINS